VVRVSGGYPQSYDKGKEITGVDKVDSGILFHAGTRIENGKLLKNGGRVLNIVGEGETLQEAIDNSYNQLKKISFEKAYYRRDIEAKGIKRLA